MALKHQENSLLESIDVRNTKCINNDNAKKILSSLPTNIEKLDLSKNNIGIEGIVSLQLILNS